MLLRDTLARIRHKVRIPLHQIISYAELIAEDADERTGTNMHSELSGIITACESALAIASAAPEGESIHAIVESMRQQLAAPRDAMYEMAARLQAISASEECAKSREDIEKLCGAVAGFTEIVNGNNTEVLFGLELLNRENGDRGPAAAYDQAAKPSNQASTVMVDGKMHSNRGVVLVVDDNEGNRDVLSRRLLRDGCDVMLAEGGRQALRMARRYNFDLILLDLMMPEMDGFAVLAELKKSQELQQLPVIMISAMDEVESVVRCIEMGADDYVLKPFNPVLMRARINALLERKRLQDEERLKKEELEKALVQIEAERKRAKELLLNILPARVADELHKHGAVQPMYFEDVTIVFADVVGFTVSTEQLPADELVTLLHEYFSSFDQIVARYGLEKLKTIGDCYMYAGGLPVRNPSHPVDGVLAALEMIHAAQTKASEGRVKWQLRIGVHTGPVIAGVVGIQKFAFDIWGESVNLASRMESSGAPSRVNLSPSTYTRVKDFFSCDRRGAIKIKDGREIEMFFVNGVLSGLLANGSGPPLQNFEGRYQAYFRKELQAFPSFLIDPVADGTSLVQS